jgi:hypothetical protein
MSVASFIRINITCVRELRFAFLIIEFQDSLYMIALTAYKSTRRHIPEDFNFHQNSCKNFKFARFYTLMYTAKIIIATCIQQFVIRVDIATSYKSDGRDFESLQTQEVFPFPKRWDPSSLLFKGYRNNFPGVKRPWR